MKKILSLMALAIFAASALSSCGKKGRLDPPADLKRPKFENFSDEMETSPVLERLESKAVSKNSDGKNTKK